MKKKNEPEQRFIEIRAVPGASGEMLVEGYAITFDEPATHQYGDRKFTEVIKRGALDFADMKDVPLRYNHNDSWMIMARTRNKSLELIVDNVGLMIRATLLDMQTNRDAYKAIEAGLIDKMSFAFTVPENGDTWTINDTESVREVNKIDKLYDVSVVDTPFYDSTSIYARSLELLDNKKRQLDSLNEQELLKLKIKIKGEL